MSDPGENRTDRMKPRAFVTDVTSVLPVEVNMDELLMLTPGPVMIPEKIREVLSRPIPHHRTAGFAETFAQVADRLKWLFQTQHPVLMLTSSGTGGFESVMLNFTRRGERIICVGGGKFGERWGAMGNALGLEVVELEVPWGESASPEKLRALLEEYPDTRMLTISHSETSTGVLHPLKELIDVVHAHASDVLIAVDGITSVGVHPVPMDAWGIDVLVSGSQKAFAVPPGMAFVAANERAWERADHSDHARYYFDLRREKKKQVDAAQTAFTPAISIVTALDVALEMMQEEGLEQIWARHQAHSEAVLAAWSAMGGSTFASTPSHCVSAVRMPDGVSAPRVRAVARDEYGVLVAGAYDEFKESVLRIGHLGFISSREVLAGLSALERALVACGATLESGAGLRAAQEVYASHKF